MQMRLRDAAGRMLVLLPQRLDTRLTESVREYLRTGEYQSQWKVKSTPTLTLFLYVYQGPRLTRPSGAMVERRRLGR